MADNLEGVEALLFDVFGTVVDWKGSVTRALESKAQQLGFHADEDWTAFTVEWREGYMRSTKEYAKTKNVSLNVDEMHRQLLEEILANPRWGHVAKVFNEEDRATLTYSWHLIDGWPDSSKGLYELKKRFVIGTLSNGNVRLLVDMAKHADLPWDVVFSSEMLGSYKPDPQTYLGAAKYLMLPPSKVALVAAHIYDLRAAASHGYKTIYVRRTSEDVGLRDTVKAKADGGEVDVVVDSLVDLEALLKGREKL
ncbi:haloacid dehalogenase [Punctularia strigosozonata HHB-11173 SS5]|uniref:Haloacid dehalogenase n=1 Tax=Punctularia strigosozonata (strain HHB-11173) TaxID=741275 RepID=R7RZR4_PUNST|nr:haloacid dehalogenase [Punctularia strigosozonata HHB-11173 SS5]EIN03473.1 haloacid dehalogenase [Punctularia strigosozonata HHB-11173 SS5]